MLFESLEPPPACAADIISALRAKGVMLWSQDGQLHYKAPKGVLTTVDIETLRACRTHLVALLEVSRIAATACGELKRRSDTSRAPFTFSQLSHWNWFRLDERPHLRQIAGALRLCGRLDLAALVASLREVIVRHEALRTRALVCDGVPEQQILAVEECGVDLDASRFVLAASEADVTRLIEQFILQPTSVVADPLFAVQLLRIRSDEHVLVIAMEHLISDGHSRSIVLRDVLTAYTQASQGHAVSLPQQAVQFGDYAVWQRDMRESRAEQHRAYWNEHLLNCERVRFPQDDTSVAVDRIGWNSVPIRICRQTTAALRNWCRLRRTTLVMSVFTAYAALALRWCDVRDAVIQYVTDGRTLPQLADVVGYFAFSLPLRVRIFASDTFHDLIDRVTAEYCNAYEHADLGYLEAQLPRPEFVHNTAFNWQPHVPGSYPVHSGSTVSQLRCSPVAFVNPLNRILQRDTEPVIVLFDGAEEILGRMAFPCNRFSTRSMQRFADNFLAFIDVLLRQPGARVVDIGLH